MMTEQTQSTWERRCLGVLFVLLSLLLVIRASSVLFTDDEAYTHLEFVLTGQWLLVEIANNHPLNTVLMAAVAPLGPASEFVLRLPNLLLGVCFIWVAGRFALRRMAFPLTFLCLLFGSYYASEFYSLARGYGLAMACNGLAMLCLYRGLEEARPRWLLWANGLLVASTAASLMSIFLYVALLVVCCYELYWGAIFQGSDAPRRCRRTAWLLLAGNLPILAIYVLWALGITQTRDPLYAATAFWPGVQETFQRMFPYGLQRIVMLAALGGSVVYALVTRRRYSLYVLAMVLMAVLGFLLSHVITEKDRYPLNRVWLPFWPVVAFLAFEPLLQLAKSAVPGIRQRIRLVGALGSLVLVSCFFLHADTVKTVEWNGTHQAVLDFLQHRTPCGDALKAGSPQAFYAYKYGLETACPESP